MSYAPLRPHACGPPIDPPEAPEVHRDAYFAIDDAKNWTDLRRLAKRSVHEYACLAQERGVIVEAARRMDAATGQEQRLDAVAHLHRLLVTAGLEHDLLRASSPELWDVDADDCPF